MIVAAHRQDRPWIGDLAALPRPAAIPRHDPGCTFCPGNLRVSGVRNPDYPGVFVFDNDHPCVGKAAPSPSEADVPFRTAPARGIARVICFDPRHDLSLAGMAPEAVRNVVLAWREEERRCVADPDLEHVLIFENRGEVTGVSNPHPHGQLYATDFVMKTMADEAQAVARHHREAGRTLLEDVVRAEEVDGRRIVYANEGAVAFVPHFARWAYEVYVVPRRPRSGVHDLTDDEAADLADCLHRVLGSYDGLWDRPFPYVLAWHNAPLRTAAPGWHAHLEIHPPLRKPDLLKYLAGPEIGGGTFLADTVPEEKAAELRAAL